MIQVLTGGILYMSQRMNLLVVLFMCVKSEEFLVKAGRRYRMATSIDGNDVRALYNRGATLSFPAQLIADIGPERLGEPSEDLANASQPNGQKEQAQSAR